MPSRTATALGMGAILLWATLASLTVLSGRLPPFQTTAIAFTIGGAVIGLAAVARGRTAFMMPTPASLALGIYGLFGFHFFLFLALRRAPPVEANLINYLWPLLIVVLAPVIVPDVHFSRRHGLAALLGFAGAALLITAGTATLGRGELAGYAFAAASALIWSTYSLMTRRFRHFPTAYVSWFCLASGLASLGCHFALEPRYWPREAEWLYLIALGLGPMGAAFFLWDRAMKHGDPRVIGNLAYLAPLISTTLLVVLAGAAFTPISLMAMALILAGAWLGR